MESVSPKVRNRTRVPTLIITIQQSFGSFGHSNQRKKKKERKKEINGIQTGKEVKLPLFADDMILSIENPKDSTRKLLELINAYIKIQDIKLTNRNAFHSYTLIMMK